MHRKMALLNKPDLSLVRRFLDLEGFIGAFAVDAADELREVLSETLKHFRSVSLHRLSKLSFVIAGHLRFQESVLS